MFLKYVSSDVELINLNLYTQNIQNIRQPLFADSPLVEYPDRLEISHFHISTLFEFPFIYIKTLQPNVKVYSPCCNIKKFCILTQFVFMFCLILRINSNDLSRVKLSRKLFIGIITLCN